MSYALTTPIGDTGTYDVMCASCAGHIGTMTAGMIARAILNRGPVICPTCRTFKCDYCGKRGNRRTQPTGHQPARICMLCLQHRMNLNLPEFMRSLVFPRREPMVNETVSSVTDDGCLSIVT